jgi:hypothetical protein
MHAGQVAPGNRQVARMLGAAGQHDCIEILHQLVAATIFCTASLAMPCGNSGPVTMRRSGR